MHPEGCSSAQQLLRWTSSLSFAAGALCTGDPANVTMSVPNNATAPSQIKGREGRESRFLAMTAKLAVLSRLSVVLGDRQAMSHGEDISSEGQTQVHEHRFIAALACEAHRVVDWWQEGITYTELDEKEVVTICRAPALANAKIQFCSFALLRRQGRAPGAG